MVCYTSTTEAANLRYRTRYLTHAKSACCSRLQHEIDCEGYDRISMLCETMVGPVHCAQRVLLYQFRKLVRIGHRDGPVCCAMYRQHVALLNARSSRCHIGGEPLLHILRAKQREGARDQAVPCDVIR